MKKVVRLTERDLTRIVKRVIIENEMDEMMDVSSDSEYYQSRKKPVSVPGEDLSTLLNLAKKWCENVGGYKMGGRLEDISLPECQKVEEMNRRFTYL
jgi:hypothetical protein